MKIKISLFLILVFTPFILQEVHIGVYSFKSNRFYEEIELFPNNNFIYKQKKEFLNIEIKGNYKIIKNEIILNSYPKKDKIIVIEKNKSKRNKREIIVKNTKGYYFLYKIDLYLKDDVIITLDNEYKTTIFNREILGFKITDTEGLSAKYMIKNTDSRIFEVQFEPIRIFENEVWKFSNNQITPIGLDGSSQVYVLKKE